MFTALVRNTLFSAMAYVAVAILNLLIVPITIKAYGLEAYGLIVLARVFLPTGFMAIVDLGVSETGTLVVARARAKGGWETASAQVTWLFTMALLMGLVMGIGLFGLGST